MSYQLSKEIQEENFNTFLSLLEPVVSAREGANWEGLKNKLINSDFKYAPASTKYHNSIEGGLCDHSLNVYYNMMSIIKNKHLEDIINLESATIVSLLHDFSKMNLYTTSVRNRKIYYEDGSKHDEMGNFDWVAEKSYATIPEEERFIYGNHEETAEFMVRTYIPLTYEESAAILNHHAGMAYDSCQGNIPAKVLSRYPLAAVLHLADMLSTFIDER